MALLPSAVSIVALTQVANLVLLPWLALLLVSRRNLLLLLATLLLALRLLAPVVAIVVVVDVLSCFPSIGNGSSLSLASLPALSTPVYLFSGASARARRLGGLLLSRPRWRLPNVCRLLSADTWCTFRLRNNVVLSCMCSATLFYFATSSPGPVALRHNPHSATSQEPRDACSSSNDFC